MENVRAIGWWVIFKRVFALVTFASKIPFFSTTAGSLTKLINKADLNVQNI